MKIFSHLSHTLSEGRSSATQINRFLPISSATALVSGLIMFQPAAHAENLVSTLVPQVTSIDVRRIPFQNITAIDGSSCINNICWMVSYTTTKVSAQVTPTELAKSCAEATGAKIWCYHGVYLVNGIGQGLLAEQTGSPSMPDTAKMSNVLTASPVSINSVIFSHNGFTSGEDVCATYSISSSAVRPDRFYENEIPNLSKALNKNPLCINLPPAEEWCAMETPLVSLAHGNMTSSSAAGHKVTAPLSVYCTGPVAYRLQLKSGANTISLSNGLKSTLTLDGKPLSTVQNGKAGSNAFALVSTLSGSPASTGTFTGSDVLMVNYP